MGNLLPTAIAGRLARLPCQPPADFGRNTTHCHAGFSTRAVHSPPVYLNDKLSRTR